MYNPFPTKETLEMAMAGMISLQHRGQESAGIAYAVLDGGNSNLQVLKGQGLVSQVFPPEFWRSIETSSIISHVRYSTSGASNLADAQPLLAKDSSGHHLALSHNGNLFRQKALSSRLMHQGHIFHTSADTEILLALLFQKRHLGLKEAVVNLISEVEGAYAAVITNGREMIGFRDRCGFRPLCWGTRGRSFFFASESCALDAVGAKKEGEVPPGGLVRFSEGDVNPQIIETAVDKKQSFCIFEFVYFSRPDSEFGGINVHLMRKQVGSLLGNRLEELPDMLVPVPESGLSSALGLAESTGLPLEMALHKHPMGGRTFILPAHHQRNAAAKLKYNLVPSLVKGKNIGLVDDSLVRGTTAQQLISLLREAGALRIHLLISSPPYCYSCYYGIDVQWPSQLAAREENSLAKKLGADKISFANLSDLLSALNEEECYCTACFTGNYPL